MKKKLIELRAHYTGELFNLVRKQVLDFSKSDTYLTYMQQGLGGLQVRPSGIFEVREEDVSTMEKMLKKAGYENEVKTSFMPLGGFRYVDEEKCEEQMEWFASHSSFRIMEREDCHE